MRLRTALAVGFLALTAWGLLRAQKPFKEYPAIEYSQFPLPSDYNQQHEWTRARFRYPDVYGFPFRRLTLDDGREFPGYWTMDYPRSDRHLLAGVRRLTRIDARSVEQVVDIMDGDEAFNWPVMYAVEPGHWVLPENYASRLREYLLRGGFLMVDDFHGDQEWRTFMDGIEQVFPTRHVEDIADDDPILHTIYDLKERFQVPSAQYFESGLTYEKGPTGQEPHWRCVRDDKGRIMIAICHNMDLGDAWEHSDEPRYLEKWASLAYRIAMNYYVYDLSH